MMVSIKRRHHFKDEIFQIAFEVIEKKGEKFNEKVV